MTHWFVQLEPDVEMRVASDHEPTEADEALMRELGKAMLEKIRADREAAGDPPYSARNDAAK